MRVAPPVILSPEERTRLHRWSRRRGQPDYRALRARIILKAADGFQDVEIGRSLGISRLTAARWRRRFLAGRLRGIDRPTTPRVVLGRIDEARVQAILRAARTPDPSRNRPWSTRNLARELGVSHTTVRRVWESYRVRPVPFEVWPSRPDPRRPLVPKDLLGIYLHPPDYALAFSLGRPPEEGSRAAGTPSSSGTVPLALDPQIRAWSRSPEVPASARRGGWLHFLAALGPLERAGFEIGLVACAPNLGAAPEFRRWRTTHPAIGWNLLDDPEEWRIRAVAAVGVLARGSRSRSFGARGELARAIRLFLTGYSPSTGPFEWVASPDEAAEGEAGFQLRYDLSVTGHPGFKKPAPVVRPMAPVADPRVREMARVVLRRSLRLRKDERVTIESWSETLEYANAFVLETLRMGGRPILLYQDEPTYWAAASEVRATHLARLGEHQRAAMARSDVFVSFFGPSDRERFHALPRPTMLKLSEYREALYRAAAKAGARAVQIALGRASEASARMYGADLARWRNELIEGTLVDPEELHRRAVPIAERLRNGRIVEIRHPNGTALRLGLRRCRPSVSDGRVPKARAKGTWELVQLPAGVVMTALDERVAEGTFRSNVANSVGVMDTIGDVAGGEWSFSAGRLERFRYDQGQDLFAQSYGRAGPGRDRPGVLSIGLNERLDRAPLLQDQACGAVTLQLGRNDHLGGSTSTYWWAWLILRGADLSIDGTPVLHAGKLV
jgi:leucyl aminopeptidase (aminopeptidase T)